MPPFLKTCAFITALSLTAWPIRADDPKDQESLVGTWMLVSGHDSGQPLPKAELDAGLTFRFTSKGSLEMTRGGDITYQGECDYRPATARGPAWADLWYGGDASCLVIYKIDGVTLTWCQAADGRVRPRTFSSSADNGHRLLVFKKKAK